MLLVSADVWLRLCAKLTCSLALDPFATEHPLLELRLIVDDIAPAHSPSKPAHWESHCLMQAQKDSYENIQLSLGVDTPADVLFATDVLAEADAATAAGWRAVLVVRPGNAPLESGHSHRVIDSLADLLDA